MASTPGGWGLCPMFSSTRLVNHRGQLRYRSYAMADLHDRIYSTGMLIYPSGVFLQVCTGVWNEIAFLLTLENEFASDKARYFMDLDTIYRPLERRRDLMITRDAV